MLENRTEIMQEQTWRKLRCASCLLVFCAVVWYCLLVTKWAMKLKPSKPIHILTALFTTRIHKENKQMLPYQPTLLKTLANTIYCMCLFQHGKQERNYARTSMVNIALRKLFAGILCGCVVLLVGCEVSEGKTTIQTYPYSNCTFHHQNSQRKQTNFTVPTDLGKTLANTIYCMCLFQHVGKQDRTHARTTQLSYSNCWSPLVGVRKKWEQIIGWKDVTFNLMVFVCVALFFGRYTVLAAGSAVLYCIHMQHCTYIICSYSICICCLHILSAVWGLSYLACFPYSICELEKIHILSVRPT